jgi:amino acid transporter
MPELRRSLSLPLVVLYGLGVTIGAGIYVLLGATAGRAGIYAPVSFVLASIVMAFSAASFAELSTRFPVSAGEAAYVRTGFQSGSLSLVVGFLVILSGVVSSAAVTVGSTG